jgi:TRAP-type transport system periplasmic protein
MKGHRMNSKDFALVSPGRRRVFVALTAAALPIVGRAATLLRFAHTDTPNGTRQQAADFFARRVYELSNGEMQVAVFHSGQWGNDPQCIERLIDGTLDFTVSATGSYASLNKALDLAMLPYLVQTYEQGWALYDRSEWFAREFAALPAKGVRILSTFEAGFRSFTTKSPIESLDAVRGKKIRSFKNAMMEATLSAMGFEPTVMPITEVYLAIQRGQVFGQENPLDTIASQRFHIVAPYLTLTQHVYSPIPMAMSEKRWLSYSEPQRRVITRAAQDASRYSRDTVVKAEQRLLATLIEQGAKIIRPDLPPWRDAVASVYELARKTQGPNADALIAQAKAVREGR